MNLSKPLLFAATYSQPGREQELFDCYDKEHIADMLKVPGINSITRYTVQTVKFPEGIARPATCLLHELEAADPETVIEQVKQQASVGNIRHSNALDGSKSIVFILKPTD